MLIKTIPQWFFNNHVELFVPGRYRKNFGEQVIPLLKERINGLFPTVQQYFLLFYQSKNSKRCCGTFVFSKWVRVLIAMRTMVRLLQFSIVSFCSLGIASPGMTTHLTTSIVQLLIFLVPKTILLEIQVPHHCKHHADGAPLEKANPKEPLGGFSLVVTI